MFGLGLIEDKELRRLEEQVASLERERGTVEGEAHRLRLRAQQAREHDLNAEALALNAGKKPPKPTEPALRAQLEDAERRVEVVQRRWVLAQGDVTNYITAHRDELRNALIGALGEWSRELAERVQVAPLLYGKILDGQRLLRKELAPPAPLEEPAEGGRKNTVDFGGVVTRANVYGEPFERGHVEAMLSYLASLEMRFMPAQEHEGAA